MLSGRLEWWQWWQWLPTTLKVIQRNINNRQNPLSFQLATQLDSFPICSSSLFLMFFKAAIVLAALAAQTLASPFCTANATQNTETSITNASAFCIMLTGYGAYPVALNEGCASTYCYGHASKLGPPMPKGYILSAHYATNTTYVQVTGCIDSSVWAQNPTDEGGQMDSHGWPYACQGYNKFVSLIEPATNSFCIRCCNSTDNSVCNTSNRRSCCSSSYTWT